MSLFNTEQLQATSQENLQVAQNLTNHLIANATKLGKLQQDAFTQLVSSQFAFANKLFAVRDIKDFAELQNEFLSPTAVLDQQLNFNREVLAVLTDSQQQVSQFADQQVAKGNEQINEAVEKLVGQAPAGSEQAVTALKSAVANANQVFGQAQTASKEAATIAENAVKQATEQSEKAAREVAQATEKNLATAKAAAEQQTKGARNATTK
ncbi:TIGR01841 family phasin [Oceanisphaera sp. IT1-181]|uniref:TIGR01841 family phasin n=1 Tax=Oceanisphaera sp. IT1-181 TaxID=3081199 RepID=UPI0029CA999D|nr:TIGR01841 family phasin [Oceanisphaera sp. IT1-181]